MKKITPILILAGILMLVGAAYAAYPSLGSGYAVDSNYHGINVPPGTDVTVTAYTTDTDVVQVTFLWKNPGGNLVWTDGPIAVALQAEKYNDMNVYACSSTHAPDNPGDWGVQALFQDSTGKTIQGVENVIAIRATSFFVIPDIPVLGTVGSLAAMLLGLGMWIKRKK